MAKNKLIFGRGIVDIDIPRMSTNPYYKRWFYMLERCYSERYHTNNPTYKECSVSDEWLLLSNFKKWMEEQKWEGLEIDKDIIIPNNKIYSPETCCFVSLSINTLFANGGDNSNRKLPKGVYYYSNHTQSRRYTSTISKYGKSVGLGSYETPEEAERAYHLARIEYIKERMLTQSDKRVRQGMQKHIDIIHTPKIKQLDGEIKEYYKNIPPRELHRRSHPRWKEISKITGRITSARNSIKNFYSKRHYQENAIAKVKEKIPKLRQLKEERKNIRGY